MAQNTATLEVWMCVDADGDYAGGRHRRGSPREVRGRLLPAERGQRLPAGEGQRGLVPLPTVIELEVEAPEEEEPATTSATSAA